MGETESGIVCGLPSEDSGSSCRQRVAKERTRLASVHNDDIRGVPFGLIEHLVILSLAISSGERTKSIHPLAMALSGISGCPAVFELLGDGNTSHFFDATECCGPITVVT